ncbi:MAG: hypothetical protein ACREQ5_28240 [Candidatus Dormibacteria bacterium]
MQVLAPWREASSVTGGRDVLTLIAVMRELEDRRGSVERDRRRRRSNRTVRYRARAALRFWRAMW